MNLKIVFLYLNNFYFSLKILNLIHLNLLIDFFYFLNIKKECLLFLYKIFYLFFSVNLIHFFLQKTLLFLRLKKKFIQLNILILYPYNKNDNSIITENSSTQCEDDSQFFEISNNSNTIEEEEHFMKNNIKALTYNSKEKKLIENTIEFIGNIIKLNYNDTFKLIDLRYSFFEIVSKKTELNNIRELIFLEN